MQHSSSISLCFIHDGGNYPSYLLYCVSLSAKGYPFNIYYDVCEWWCGNSNKTCSFYVLILIGTCKESGWNFDRVPSTMYVVHKHPPLPPPLLLLDLLLQLLLQYLICPNKYMYTYYNSADTMAKKFHNYICLIWLIIIYFDATVYSCKIGSTSIINFRIVFFIRFIMII